MINNEQIENFVEKDLISGEELCYLSKIKNPDSPLKNWLTALFVTAIIATILFLLPDTLMKSTAQQRLLIVGAVSAILLILYLLWAILFYKKSSRRIIATSNLRFLIYQYPFEVHKLNEENIENYETLKDISFERVESMKLTEDRENHGVLAMIYDEENEEKNGYIPAKLHLEIDDCSKLRESIPKRMRPEGTKEDYWERTYDD